MAQQIIVNLSDDEYAALEAEAYQQGIPLQTYVHAKLKPHTLPSVKNQPPTPPLTQEEFLAKLYREGKITHIPTGEADTPEEEAERARLAKLLGQGKPVSEMIIEDRGPR